MSSYVYATDLCRTVLYKVDNCLSTSLEVQWIICKTGSVLNNAEHVFAKGNIVNVKLQRNVRFLQSPNEIKERLNVNVVPTHLTKQHNQEWIDSRRKAKVTGSTIYAAIGCDSLKKQKQHFDKVISGVEADEPSKEQQNAMRHGTKSEIHEIATLSRVIMPSLFPDMIFHEDGYYIYNDMVVSPDGSLRSADGIELAFEGKPRLAISSRRLFTIKSQLGTSHKLCLNKKQCLQNLEHCIYHGQQKVLLCLLFLRMMVSVERLKT
ncbi:Hypothetical predicted protein [Mytilus galloprovincialis]|uniref:YqaJ viral recombinase domain-containing protein n=1 Tax=Mytilus galloprovincialis TaxID=29158 RepID=A0A8B6G381_MYTGA|nr:Hypothetical predicted protein [Mytilus galloprovincialis]